MHSVSCSWELDAPEEAHVRTLWPQAISSPAFAPTFLYHQTCRCRFFAGRGGAGGNKMKVTLGEFCVWNFGYGFRTGCSLFGSFCSSRSCSLYAVSGNVSTDEEYHV